jgi:hypothetical protein
MEISRRGFLKLFATLPAAFAVTQLTPAFAKIPDLTPIVVPETKEDFGFFDISDIEIRFSDFRVYASSMNVVHNHGPSFRTPYEVVSDERGQYLYSELRIQTTSLTGRCFANLGDKLRTWFEAARNMGPPDSYKKDAEIWYKGERIATLKGAFLKSIEAQMFGNLMNFDFTMSYDVLEHLNG